MTKPWNFSTILSLSVLTLAGLVIFLSQVSAAGSRPPAAVETASGEQMSQEELPSAVISYANRFIATIYQAAFNIEEAIPTPQGRLIASARKVYSLSAATEIAAGANPGPALLDLVVMATLNRMVWEDYWRPPEFFNPHSDRRKHD